MPEPPAPSELARDRGLARGIGPLGLAGSVVNNVVGAGIFTLPASIALLAGGAAPLAYGLGALIVGGVVVCFAEAGSRVPTSGGAYGAVAMAFGPAAGAVTGIVFLASNILADAGVAAALADSAGGVLAPLAHGAGRLSLLAAIYALMLAGNLRPVAGTARLLAVVAGAKLLPLIGFIALGLLLAGHGASAQAAPSAAGALPFARAVVLTIFAFSGYECALLNSGEIADPARTLPRALLLSMLAILGLYLGVQIASQNLLGAALAHSDAPLAEGAAHIRPWLGHAMLAAAALAMLGFLASDVLGSSRLLFAFGRDGLMPRWLGGLAPHTDIPARAVATYGVAAFLLAASGSFLELVFLSGLAVILVYALNCAASLVLARRGVALAGKPLGFPALSAAASVGFAGVAALALSARPIELLGLALLVAISLGLHGLRRRRPARAPAPDAPI